jgi:hypothetical protein
VVCLPHPHVRSSLSRPPLNKPGANKRPLYTVCTSPALLQYVGSYRKLVPYKKQELADPCFGLISEEASSRDKPATVACSNRAFAHCAFPYELAIAGLRQAGGLAGNHSCDFYYKGFAAEYQEEDPMRGMGSLPALLALGSGGSTRG